jgi:uncharacterized protein (DUF2336 family)
MSAQPTIFRELEEAISHGQTGRRSEMLHRVVDLFVVGALHYSEEQIALFDDVIARLADQIETSVRAELAARLAAIPNAPPIVIRNFASDKEIAVAGPVLTQSDRLDDATLVEISKISSQPHLLAISRRKALNEMVTDVLVEQGGRDVVLSVVANSAAKFSQPGYATLIRRSEGDDEIAVCVGSRPDIPRHLFLHLLAKASETVRNKLAPGNSPSAHRIQEVIASVASRIAAETAMVSRNYHFAQAQIERLHASGKLDETDLNDFAEAGRFEEVVAALAMLSGMRIEIVERAMMQERSETLLILTKALGLSWPTVKSLLLLRSHGQGMSVQDLDQCLTNFQRLKQLTARQILCFPGFSAKLDS